MEQNTDRTKCKNSKIKTRQNTNCQNTNVTKYKCNKIQMKQNTNRTKCKNSKLQMQQNTNWHNKNGTKYKWFSIPVCKFTIQFSNFYLNHTRTCPVLKSFALVKFSMGATVIFLFFPVEYNSQSCNLHLVDGAVYHS